MRLSPHLILLNKSFSPSDLLIKDNLWSSCMYLYSPLREDLYLKKKKEKKKEKTGKFCFKLSHLKLNLFMELQRDMRQRSGSHFIISVFLSKGPAIERASEPPPQCTSASLSVYEGCASVCASAAANPTVINSCRSKKKKKAHATGKHESPRKRTTRIKCTATKKTLSDFN